MCIEYGNFLEMCIKCVIIVCMAFLAIQFMIDLCDCEAYSKYFEKGHLLETNVTTLYSNFLSDVILLCTLLSEKILEENPLFISILSA